jgi:muramoyltetrapeptide carboxypeptidase
MLRPGDRVAVIAPASAADSDRIRRGTKVLESLGFEALAPRQAFLRRGRYAGTDAERARALLRAIADPDVRAIVFTRGGFGAARILPLVADILVKAAPKIVVGYSDATSLLAFLTGKLGWVTFHGPMIASDFGALAPRDRASFLAALTTETPSPLRLSTTIRRGRTEGRIFGGCLSIIVSLLGTPYAVDLADRILFLEDVNEEPYQLDRMLTQLRQAGQLDRTRGIVFGEMDRCGRRRDLVAVLEERTADLGVPVALGLPSGHGRGKRTLPLGALARLDATNRRLEILEAAVTP